MRRLARFVATLAVILIGTDALPDEEAHVSFVPWKVVAPGEPVDAPLALFWIPYSADELRRSRLLTSTELTLFSARCVAMRVVRFDDDERLASFREEEGLPIAVLVVNGEVVTRVFRENDVEPMVREMLDAREQAADERLDEARRHAAARELDEAVALYQSVLEERCVCPRQARDAQRALKKLKR